MRKKLLSLTESDREAIRAKGSADDKKILEDFQRHCDEVVRLMYAEIEVPNHAR